MMSLMLTLTLRLALSDSVTWADLTEFVDIARGQESAAVANLVEMEFDEEATTAGPSALVVELDSTDLSGRAVVIDADSARQYAEALETIVTKEGDARAVLEIVEQLRAQLDKSAA